MGGVQDAVEHGVAHRHVAGGHVDPRAEDAGAVGEFSRAHAAKEVEALVDGAVAIGAVAARLGQRAAHRADLVDRRIVDIGVAATDQMLGPVVKLLEIIRGEVQVLAPIEAEPVDVSLDRVDIFLLLLGRVGVVKA